MRIGYARTPGTWDVWNECWDYVIALPYGYMQADLWQAVRYRGAKRRFPHHLDRKREMTNIPYLNKEQALIWIYGLRCLFENQRSIRGIKRHE